MRHFQTEHQGFSSNVSDDELLTKAKQLQERLKKEQNVFTKLSSVKEAATRASFVIAHAIVKHNKPFSDDAFLKQCMTDVAKIMWPESKRRNSKM